MSREVFYGTGLATMLADSVSYAEVRSREPEPEPSGPELMAALLAKPSRIKVSKSRAKPAPEPEPERRCRGCGLSRRECALYYGACAFDRIFDRGFPCV